MKKFRARVIVDFEVPDDTLNVDSALQHHLENNLLHKVEGVVIVNKIEITGSYDIIPGDQHRHMF